MLLINQHRIYRKDLQANPRILYIFGDNLMRVGLGGQAAEMRGEPNAFGFATKVSPSHSPNDLLYDDDTVIEGRVAGASKGIVILELRSLKNVLDSNRYDAVVWPLDGIGTGLAAMPDTAPELLKYLTEEIFSLVEQA